MAWGVVNYARRHRWMREMEAAAARLPFLRETCRPSSLEVHYLTGPRHWFMTAFCHFSLLRASGEAIAAVVHSDGTLAEAQRTALLRIFPDARFPEPEKIAAHLDQCLPRSCHPVLREQRERLVFLRKLLDVQAGRSGPAVVLDSDVLFFHRPDELLAWMARPEGFLVLKDVGTYYGYSAPLLSSVVGGLLPACVNAGLVAIPERSEIDWDWLERAVGTLVAREGLSYYLEQVIDAMLYRRGPLTYLDSSRYVVAPKTAATRRRAYAMGHFVAASRMNYLKYGWRQILADAEEL